MSETVVMIAKFSADVSEFVSSTHSVATSAKDAGAAIKEMASGAASGNFSQMASGAKEFGTSIMTLGQSIMDVVGQAQMLIMAAKQIGEAIVGPAMHGQDAMNAMKNQMGGASQASQQLYQDIQKLAIVMALPTDDLESVAKHMLNIGVAAKNVVPELTAVSKAIVASGGGTEQIQAVIEKLNEMQNKAQVSMDDISELGNQGFKSWETMAAGAGTSVEEMMAKVKSGSMSATEAVNDLVKGMDKLNKDATGGNTFSQQWTKFTDQLGALAQMLLGPVLEGFTAIMAIVTKVGDGLGALGENIGHLFGNNDVKGQQDQLVQAINSIGVDSTKSSQSVSQFNASLNATGQSAGQASSTVSGLTQTTGQNTQALTQNTQAMTQGAQASTLNAQASTQLASAQAQVMQGFAQTSQVVHSASGYYDQLTTTVSKVKGSYAQFTVVTIENTQAVTQNAKDLNEHIKEFAAQTHQSYDSASQAVRDYANFTQQSMDQAAKALAGPQVKSHLDQYVQENKSLLQSFVDNIGALMDSANQRLGSIGGKIQSLSMGNLNATIPGFASGVQNYTGMAIVGEDGPELVNLNGGSVTPLTGNNTPSVPAIGGLMGGGNSGPLHVTLMIDGQAFGMATFPHLAPIMRAAVGVRQ